MPYIHGNDKFQLTYDFDSNAVIGQNGFAYDKPKCPRQVRNNEKPFKPVDIFGSVELDSFDTSKHKKAEFIVIENRLAFPKTAC